MRPISNALQNIRVKAAGNAEKSIAEVLVACCLSDIASPQAVCSLTNFLEIAPPPTPQGKV